MTNRSGIRLGNSGFPSIPVNGPFTTQTVPGPDNKAYDSKQMKQAISTLNETNQSLKKAVEELGEIDVSRVMGLTRPALERVIKDSEDLVNGCVSVVDQAISTIQTKVEVLENK